MGLREKKAAQSRDRMVSAAIELFERDGYDATTMEQIAARADVGTTTLYRYFPSKDLLLLDELAQVLDLAPHLRARPEDEDLETALGQVLLTLAHTVDDPRRNIAATRRLIDKSPTPRAKLWDLFLSARESLEVAIGERLGTPPTSLSVRVTAALTLELAQMIDEMNGRSPGTREEITASVLTQLADATIHLPRMAAR
jgi:AcrR family transcriptional regulator